MALDWDELLSYKTYRVVRIRDWRLGVIHYLMIVIILAYVGLYVFYYERNYYDVATSTGSVAIKIKGDAYSVDPQTGEAVIFDSVDIVQPSIEASAAFIASSVISTNNQTRSICGNPALNCTRDSDCPNKPPLQLPTCSQGYCLGRQWCPAENLTLTGQAMPDSASVQGDIVNADVLTLWLKATMSFPSLSETVNYSTIFQKDPVTSGPLQNLYSLHNLLNMTQTNYTEIIDRGCILLVRLAWECYLDSSVACFPKISTVRLDNRSIPTGFNFRLPSYYRDELNVLHRDVFKYTGTRIFFVSTGTGYKVSVAAIILQLSSAVALLAIANVVTDLVLEYIMPQRKRYTKYKFLETEEFSALRGAAAINSNYGGTDPSLPILAVGSRA